VNDSIDRPATRSLPPKPDRRVIVTALGLTQIFAWGSTFYLLGVLALPVANDTGWALDWVMGGVSMGLLTAGLMSPHVGRTIGDRGGGLVLATGAALLGTGLVLLAVAQNLLWYLCAWLTIGAGMSASLYDAAFATLGSIYGKEARGAITSLTLLGGFASTVCWPLSAYLVEHVGWRDTCLAYAVIQLCFALPLHLLVVPRRSFVRHDRTDAQEAPANALLEGETLIFRVLAAVLAIGAAILSMMGTHLLPILQARGTDLILAVSLGTLVGPSQVAARVIEMLGGRHYHPIWTMIASTVLVAIGALWLLAGWPVVAIAIVFYGAGNGIGSVARGTLPLTLFGPERYAALMGRLALPILLSMTLAPYLGALALKVGGAALTLALLFGLAVTNLMLVLVLRRLCT
jgi:predicted MFS family arabinose efflux permease